MIYENCYMDKLYPVKDVKSLKDMLQTCKDMYGNKASFLYKEQKGSPYKEVNFITLKDDVDALGTQMLELGLQGENIAIIGENCYQWMVTYFAVVNGVGKVVPLDKELSKEEVENLIDAAGCKAVFYTGTYKNYFKNINIEHKYEIEVYHDNASKAKENTWQHLVMQGRMLMGTGNREFLDIEIDPMEVKMLLFTSGTTDVPKAVMLCHNNIIANIKDISKIVHLQPNDRSLSILPIHHTFESTVGIMTMLFQGCSVAFCEGLKHVVKNLEEAQATVLVGVPLIFESMYSKIWKQAEKSKLTGKLKSAIKLNKALKKVGIDAGRKIFKSVYESFGGKLRLLITGAAAIKPEVVRGFQDLGFDICMGYGLTETSPLLTGTPDFTDRYKKAGSAGVVVPSGQLKIIDKGDDGIGEIAFTGPNMMLGYYNMPEKTAEVIKEGWFHTGDLGFVDEKGWLYITGRKKNVIVTKTGKNIYPEELEEYLKKNAYISECMVYGEEVDETGETVVSVQIIPDYELLEDAGIKRDVEKIYKLIKGKISDMNEELPVYKRIKNVVIREKEFIKTTTKKIKRHENL